MIYNSLGCSGPEFGVRSEGQTTGLDSHLARVLQKVLPFCITHTRLFLEDFEVSKLPVFAKDQGDHVVEALCLFSPLPLDNPGTGPSSFGHVVRVLFLLRATGNEIRKQQTYGKHRLGDGNVSIYLRRPKGFAMLRLHKGAARSAKKRSRATVMFPEKICGLGTIDGRS